MEALIDGLAQLSTLHIILFGSVILLIWFLPAILSLFFNPKHTKLIALACIPAGFSFIAWGALILWATTGKVFDKYRDKVQASSS
jgi:hypothetical protein